MRIAATLFLALNAAAFGPILLPSCAAAQQPGQISAAPVPAAQPARPPLQIIPAPPAQALPPGQQPPATTPAPVIAQPPLSAAPDTATRPALQIIAAPEVAQVEKYLNGISTMQAHFVQTANDGKQMGGTFQLKRPGRLRFEYEGPVHDFIVADGTFIHYYDAKMKQNSSALISKSLADFFLRRDLKLSGDLKVVDLKRQDGLLLLTVMDGKDEGVGTLTLGFTENPLQLKKWRIIDSQGAMTEIQLFDAVTGIKLDNKLFDYYDPEHGKPRYN